MERLAIYHAGREIDPEDLDLPPSLGDETLERMETPFDERELASACARRRAPSNIVLDVPDAGTTFDALEKSILAQMLRATTATNPPPRALSASRRARCAAASSDLGSKADIKTNAWSRPVDSRPDREAFRRSRSTR